MKKITIYLISIFFIQANVFAQSANGLDKEIIPSTPNKTGLSYEALSKFFQSSLTTGDNGGLNFKATWFGIEQLFCQKKDLNLSNYFLANKFKRNFELSFGANKDTAQKINVIALGIKYALINHRSKPDYNYYHDSKLIATLTPLDNIKVKADKIYEDNVLRPQKLKLSEKKYNELWEKYSKAKTMYDTSGNINDLPRDYIPIFLSIAAKSGNEKVSDLIDAAQKAYKNAIKATDTRGLLTVSFNPGFNVSMCRFDTTTLAFQYLVGLGKNIDKPWNLDLQGRYAFVHDTTGTKYSVARKIAILSVGFNKTLLNDDKGNPIIEFEPALEDDNVIAGRYLNETQNVVTFNSTLRIHLSSQLTLPITLKYDVVHPNLLGIFQLNWNLESK